MYLRCIAGQRSIDADHRITRLIVNVNQLSPSLCRRQGFGNHHGDMIADIAHPVEGQDRMRARPHLATVL